MLTPHSAAYQRGQWSLIGSLVAVAIIIILAAVYLPRLVRPSGTPNQDVTVMQRADAASCMIYQSELNTAVQSYKIDHDGRSPRTLDELKNSKYGVTEEMLHSPGCTLQMGPDGNVTMSTRGTSPMMTPAPTMPGQPAAPPPPSNGTRGPGGVTIPNIPGAGSTSVGGDTGE